MVKYARTICGGIVGTIVFLLLVITGCNIIADNASRNMAALEELTLEEIMDQSRK